MIKRGKIVSIVGVFVFLAVVAAAPNLVAIGHERPEIGTVVKVKQDPGKVVYWVLPGPRRLSKKVFGTPDNPKALVKPKIEEAKGPFKQLLRDLPFLVGLPLKARGVDSTGTRFTVAKIPTLFSDRAKVTSGQLEITYIDRRPYDLPGKPGATPDDVDLKVKFTDPAGNNYELRVDHVIQPPIPGYETAGGVMTNAFHHGLTGTGSPLMPRVYTYGAFWGVGDVVINGRVVDKRKVMHFMTTQTVRDKDYRLAVDEELPLAPKNTIAGQVHHTHVVVLPITVTAKGPKFAPVKTAFTLPNGMKQPFIHIMFEQDTIVEAPFKGWSWPAKKLSKARIITVTGKEYSFNHSEIRVKKGETITVTFKNVGTIAHNLTIGTFGIRTETIQSGESTKITFKSQKAGVFPFWCSVPGHRSAGMEGKIIVEG